MRRIRQPTIPAARPTPQLIADARRVVARPELYASRPMLLSLAWRVLAAARGA